MNTLVKKDQIISLYKELKFLRYFLMHSKMMHAVCKLVTMKDLVHQLQYLIYQAISDVYWSVTFHDRMEEVMTIKTTVMEIYDK